jgi:PmbA protein
VKSTSELRLFVRDGASALARERDIGKFELYASSAENEIARINYTSGIPSRGLEEFKTLAADGFQVRIAMRDNPRAVGIASQAGDFSSASLREALTRARDATIVDPFFGGFGAGASRISTPRRAAPGLARTRDRDVCSAAWTIVRSAVAELSRARHLAGEDPGFIVGGDISIIRDRIAVASSRYSDVRADESAHYIASVAALIESRNAKGTASAIGGSRDAMLECAPKLGRDAVRRAIALADGVRPPSGMYRVVLGPQPTAEILNYMVMGSMTTGSFHAASSCFQGRFGAPVMDSRISISDVPAHRGGGPSRTITCEGVPAREIELIRAGKLRGLLSNVYDSHRILADENRAEKLGPSAPAALEFPPVSGYRLGGGGERRFDASAGSSGTNVVMRTRGGLSNRAMLQAVGDGIYVGRVWYTYPINGQRAGDFTCTVSGDSYFVRDGKIAEPVAPNSLRINANIAAIFERPLQIGARSVAATVWGSPEIYFVPEIAATIAMSAIEPPARS